MTIIEAKVRFIAKPLPLPSFLEMAGAANEPRSAPIPWIARITPKKEALASNSFNMNSGAIAFDSE